MTIMEQRKTIERLQHRNSALEKYIAAAIERLIVVNEGREAIALSRCSGLSGSRISSLPLCSFS
jgi:hypothetical protein